MIDYNTFKNILFKLEPETAHLVAEYGLRVLPYCRILNNYFIKNNFIIDAKLNQKIFGLDFYNPIGLGAGFDKNGTMINSMLALGFGFSEIGTITKLSQGGNEKPRLFRYSDVDSLQNGMGFNNDGAYEITKRIKKIYPFTIPLGINIGKNKQTAEHEAINDYRFLIENFKNLADYIVVNISSPNTPNLRDLQNEKFIKSLFNMAKQITSKPILLKIAPDMEVAKAIELSLNAVQNGASGIIISNTSTDYSLLKSAKNYQYIRNFGGISGDVLKDKSYLFFKNIAKELFGKTILISSGGISTADEAYKRLKAGASLIQIFTGLIFKGPNINKNINTNLLKLMDKDNFKDITEVIGSDLRG